MVHNPKQHTKPIELVSKVAPVEPDKSIGHFSNIALAIDSLWEKQAVAFESMKQKLDVVATKMELLKGKLDFIRDRCVCVDVTELSHFDFRQ